MEQEEAQEAGILSSYSDLMRIYACNNDEYQKICKMGRKYPQLRDKFYIFRLDMAAEIVAERKRKETMPWASPSSAFLDEVANSSHTGVLTVIADDMTEVAVAVMSERIYTTSAKAGIFAYRDMYTYIVPTKVAQFFEAEPTESEAKRDWETLLSVAPIIYDTRKERGKERFVGGVPLVEFPNLAVDFAWEMAGQYLIDTVDRIVLPGFGKLRNKDAKRNKPGDWTNIWYQVLYGGAGEQGRMSYDDILSALSGGRADEAAIRAIQYWEKCKGRGENGELEKISDTIGILTGDEEEDRQLLELYQCLGALEVWNHVELRSNRANGEIYLRAGDKDGLLEEMEIVRKASGIEGMMSLVLDDGVPLADVIM